MASQLKHTVMPSGGDFTSLDAAIDHLVASHADLVSADVYADVEISGSWSSADTTKPIISGITADATRYINIYTTGDAKHVGVWSTSKYRLDYADQLLIYVSYTRITGIQASLASNGVYVSSAADAVILDGLIVKVNTGTPGYGIRFDGASSSTGTVRNCIVYGGFSRGIALYYDGEGRTLSVYNCTVSGCGTAGIADRQGSHVVATNCAVFNNGDDFAGTFSSITYCASDDGDGTNAVNISPGATEADDWANAFVDYANGDFHVKNTSSVLYNAGNDLSGTFTDDIDGDTRSQWDIGADEYVASGASSTPSSTPFLKPFRQAFGRGGF